jgi:hypothetical protein
MPPYHGGTFFCHGGTTFSWKTISFSGHVQKHGVLMVAKIAEWDLQFF